MVPWAVLAALVVGTGAAGIPTADAPPVAAPSRSVHPAPDAEELRRLVDEGAHPDLRWREFPDVQAAVARFYDARGEELAWTRRGVPTPAARALAGLLARADVKGLEPLDYDGPQWARAVEPGGGASSAEDDAACSSTDGASRPDEQSVRLDVGLTVSAMRYLADLQSGRVDPRRLDFELASPRRPVELAPLLERIAGADPAGVEAAVATAEPPFAAYRRTLAAIETYRRLSATYDAIDFSAPVRALRVNDRYEGVAELARMLELLGDLRPGASAGASRAEYDAPLAEAVRRFQQRHGLDVDGRLGEETAAELAVPLSRRSVQLALTLERWRWLPRELATPLIVVNIPEFRLYAGDGERRFTTRVAVGKAYGQRTPVFASRLSHVVFHPYWNVPRSIQRDELVPRVAVDPGYLARNGYELVDRRGKVVSAPPGSPGTLGQLRSGELALRQRPGPGNALGAVKFVFPNTHGVYLHGTSARELFSRSRRAVTHGCIRVEEPADLAAWVLRDEPEWTRARIEAAMGGAATVQVRLRRETPVLVLYGTAVVSAAGEVRFFRDVYGHDAALERALDAVHRERTGSATAPPPAVSGMSPQPRAEGRRTRRTAR